ncbi:MAG: CheY-like chemotaxis protein [Candidatus Latescibacterota bacterium]|jgi:CheY-like chemotaxis protein
MPAPKHILVVDDEPIVCMTIKEILTSFGYQVTVLHNGLEAKECLSTQTFALILSDISMPGLDGLSLLAYIQEQKPNIPVIIMAGLADPQITQRALNQGAKACVEKPVKLQDLHTLIETYI